MAGTSSERHFSFGEIEITITPVPVRSEPELVARVDPYRIFKYRSLGNSIGYSVFNNAEEEQPLLLELTSNPKQPSYLSITWGSTTLIEEFLSQVDNFFDNYANLIPGHENEVGLVIQGDKGFYVHEDKRPITIDHLKRARQNDLLPLPFLRIQNNTGVFTWTPEETGIAITPNKFPSQEKLHSSVILLYQKSKPVLPTELFEQALNIVTKDASHTPKV